MLLYVIHFFYRMTLITHVNIWVTLMLINLTAIVESFNQPNFCPNALWNPNGSTFADSSVIGSDPWDIFITSNNTIYVPNKNTNYMIVWSSLNSTPIRNISLSPSNSVSVFTTEDDYMYYTLVTSSINRILRFSVVIMETPSGCFDIFIDILDNIYCSLDANHLILRKTLANLLNPIKIIAGTGIIGSTSYTLYYPNGIFVDTNLDLYVADSWNHRIQLFPLDITDGITVAGNTSSTPTITLNYPMTVILDINKYLFIVDTYNSRIVGSNQYGFQCIIGCNGSGSTADQLNEPRSMNFDSFGNIFVSDAKNNRIQKFQLITNSCSKFNRI